jgi:hypothetical protein
MSGLAKLQAIIVVKQLEHPYAYGGLCAKRARSLAAACLDLHDIIMCESQYPDLNSSAPACGADDSEAVSLRGGVDNADDRDIACVD